jgi:hypothetical protein
METELAKVDAIAQDFNMVDERKYWKAQVGGTRIQPCVFFKSRSSMIEISYFPATEKFIADFTKVSSAFGDYMAGLHKALATILGALKAAGYTVAMPLNARDGVLRIEFNPSVKTASIMLAHVSDTWRESNTDIGFKVAEEANENYTA